MDQPRGCMELIAPEDTAALDILLADRFGSEPWKQIDEAEERMEESIALGDMAPAKMILRHLYPKGLYVREIFMPAGTLLVTRIHLEQHPFFISKGIVSVWDKTWATLFAAHTDITQPGTRRILYVHEDCIWSTVHLNPDELRDPDEIVRRVTYSKGKYVVLGAAAAAPTLQS